MLRVTIGKNTVVGALSFVNQNENFANLKMTAVVSDGQRYAR